MNETIKKICTCHRTWNDQETVQKAFLDTYPNDFQKQNKADWRSVWKPSTPGSEPGERAAVQEQKNNVLLTTNRNYGTAQFADRENGRPRQRMVRKDIVCLPHPLLTMATRSVTLKRDAVVCRCTNFCASVRFSLSAIFFPLQSTAIECYAIFFDFRTNKRAPFVCQARAHAASSMALSAHIRPRSHLIVRNDKDSSEARTSSIAMTPTVRRCKQGR